jgi:hypothetical protein
LVAGPYTKQNQPSRDCFKGAQNQRALIAAGNKNVMNHTTSVRNGARGSFDLYQLDRFVARTFDYDGARVSELVWAA